MPISVTFNFNLCENWTVFCHKDSSEAINFSQIISEISILIQFVAYGLEEGEYFSVRLYV